MQINGSKNIMYYIFKHKEKKIRKILKIVVGQARAPNAKRAFMRRTNMHICRMLKISRPSEAQITSASRFSTSIGRNGNFL